MKPNEMIWYLIGQITADVRTYDWRKQIRKRFAPEKERIKFFDPCDNGFNKMVLEFAEDVQKFREMVRDNPQFSQIIPTRDMGYVFASDGAICDLNPYTPEKPFIGTFFELAWYRLTPWKPVVGVFEGDHTMDLTCRHPFVWDSITTWVKTYEEACDLVEKMYL